MNLSDDDKQHAFDLMSIFEENYINQMALHNDIRAEYNIIFNSVSVVTFFLRSKECKLILSQMGEMDRDICILLRSIDLARKAEDAGIIDDFVRLSRTFFNQVKTYNSKWIIITENIMKLAEAITEADE